MGLEQCLNFLIFSGNGSFILSFNRGVLLFERTGLIRELLSSLGHKLDLGSGALKRIVEANVLSHLATRLVDSAGKFFTFVLVCHAFKPLFQILSNLLIEFYLTFHLFHFVNLALYSILHQLCLLRKLFLDLVASSLSLGKSQNLPQARKKIVRLDAFHDDGFASIFNFNLFVNDLVLEDASELKVSLGLFQEQLFLFNLFCKFFAFLLALLEDDKWACLDLVVEELLAKRGFSHLCDLFLLQPRCLPFCFSYHGMVF